MATKRWYRTSSLTCTTAVVMAHRADRYLFGVAVLLCCTAALAQSSGAVSVTAMVERSVLLSGVAPGGEKFSQGSVGSAAVVIALLPGSRTQTLSSRALVANDPHSAEYEMVARVLRSPAAKVTLDGVQLSTSDTVISPHAPYEVVETHTIEVEGGTASDISIILSAKPR